MAAEAKLMPAAVLFACSRNAVRSPMAAAIAHHYFGHSVKVDSAGVEPGDLDVFAIAVLAELGIDIANYRPKGFEALEGSGIDLIVTLSPEAHHRALDLAEHYRAAVEYWPLPDPTLALELGLSRAAILESYRQARDALTERILARFSQGPLGNI